MSSSIARHGSVEPSGKGWRSVEPRLVCSRTAEVKVGGTMKLYFALITLFTVWLVLAVAHPQHVDLADSRENHSSRTLQVEGGRDKRSPQSFNSTRPLNRTLIQE